MRLTIEQQELMGRCGLACAKAGNDIRAAKTSVDTVTAGLNELIGTLEDPDERASWKRVRSVWVRIAVLLQDAASEFESGGVS